MAGTTFPEMLKPLFVYNFHRCVGKTIKLSRPVPLWVFVGVTVLELEVVVMVGADMRMQLPMRGWEGLMKENN